jgi:apolipoprotein N-acyltransferase
VAVLPWIAGLAIGGLSWTEASGPTVRTTIVQGGVSQDRKWLSEQFTSTLDLYRGSILENGDSDLVIWPEVAIPSYMDLVENYISQLELDIAARNQTLLFGILERDLAAKQLFNSVVAIGGDGRQIYRKRHLVPFGEYFPVPDFVREWMRLMSLPNSNITSGADVQPLLKMPDGNLLSVAICYEDAFATEQLYALPDAGILVNVSNDAWFGDSIAPHQHLQIARMRALEAGRHVVRATNNGVSAFIGPDGHLLAQGPQFEFVAMTYDVQPRTGLTPFARLGNWPVILITLLIILWIRWRSRAT